MLDFSVLNICMQTQKQLTNLNNFRALLESLSIDLHARNFVHAKTFLRARCVHARHCARNLQSPALEIFLVELIYSNRLVQLNIFTMIYFAKFSRSNFYGLPSSSFPCSCSYITKKDDLQFLKTDKENNERKIRSRFLKVK